MERKKMDLFDSEALRELQEESRKHQEKYEAENTEWWNSLTERERENAFYEVCKRIYQGDVESKGSYRYVLYDVFGFDMAMYGHGMQCRYIDIHNLLIDGQEYEKMSKVNRIEVIDGDGRSYVKHLDKCEYIKYSLQDDDRTLKVIVKKEP
jgi:hypothetical protein